VAGATLTLVNTATGSERTTISSSVGAYDFQALQPGSKMTVEAQGFKKAVDTDITISVATATQVNIPLRLVLRVKQLRLWLPRKSSTLPAQALPIL
jgi:hypothetical protein